MQNDKNGGGQVGWQAPNQSRKRVHSAHRRSNDDNSMSEHKSSSVPYPVADSFVEYFWDNPLMHVAVSLNLALTR